MPAPGARNLLLLGGQTWLQSLRHGPRILVVGESVVNSGNLLPRLQSLVPGLVGNRRTYGASQSPMGLLVTATDAQAYVTPGNLIPNTDASTWSLTAATIASTRDPVSGAATQHAAFNGTNGQKIVAGSTVVPAGAPHLTYSLLLNQGTLLSYQMLLQNQTRAGQVLARTFGGDDIIYHNGFPARVYLTARATDGVGYAAGDVLRPYFYANLSSGNVAGDCYISEAMVNVGDIPAPFVATAGVAQTIGSPAWTNVQGGISRGLFDLVIIEWGRNDAGAIDATNFAHTLTAMVNGVATNAKRVLLASPPPLCQADFSAWNLAADTFDTTGLRSAMAAVAAATGAGYYDAWSDFQAQVSSGAYTIAQLMRDTMHPTDSSLTSPGMGLYVNGIYRYLRSQTLPSLPLGSFTPMARIGGPLSGGWAWTPFTDGASSWVEPQGLLIADGQGSHVQALTSSTVGDVLSYTVTGSVIGLIALVDATTVGTANVSIDGGAAILVNLQQSGLQFYPHGFIIATGLTATSHTVTVTVASGQARIVGVVGA